MKTTSEALVCMKSKWPKGKNWTIDFNQSECDSCKQRDKVCARVWRGTACIYFKLIDNFMRGKKGEQK